MHRLRRIGGWICVALVGGFVVLNLAANLYVQSQGTHARIEQELSQRIGMPLQIQRISVMPWGGLRLSGITIPQPHDPGAPRFLEAHAFELRVRLHSIFWRPLIIKKVTLVHPSVIWPQNLAGKWRLPSAGPAEPARTEHSRVPSAQAEPAVSGDTSEASVPRPTSSEDNVNSPQVRGLKLVEGNFHFLDRQNKDVALFQGVNFSSTLRQSNSIRGQARIAKIALRNRLFLSAVRSPIRYDPALLELSAMSGQVAKGKITGVFSMKPQAQDSPFSMRANFGDVDADELVAEAGGSRDLVRGVLEGTFEATGKTADPNALTGSGRVTLRGGHVQQFAVLAALGQSLQIEELTRLDLEEAEATYHLSGETVQIDELNLQSQNLRLTATGSVTLNGKLALSSTLAINDKIRGQLFRPIRDNFVATSEPGQYALQFHVGGTLDKPKTDLMARAVGADLRNFNGVIDALLGRGKAKKKKKDTEPVLPSPSVSPP